MVCMYRDIHTLHPCIINKPIPLLSHISFSPTVLTLFKNMQKLYFKTDIPLPPHNHMKCVKLNVKVKTSICLLMKARVIKNSLYF